MEKILIIDVNKKDRETAAALLAGAYQVHSCAGLPEAAEMVAELSPAAVLLDVASCKVDGRYDPLGAALNSCAGVVCSATAEAIREYVAWCGGSGFVEKPYDAAKLKDALRFAAARARRSRGRDGAGFGRGDHGVLIGDSPQMKAVVERIGLYASHDAPVLILGESGTGKELAAAAIHRASPRGFGRFLPFDCAAVPETLVESYLFGTTKGAFTGSVDGKGLFESAEGGTVFLDEIGELSLSVQAKFLRTLETGCGTRVGSVEPISYDIRLVSATNSPLYDDPRRFRPELLHRIDTLVLRLPPLRDHKSDIKALAEAFAREFGGVSLGDAALDKLHAWDWPGNVRELKNVIRRAVVLSGKASRIEADHVEFGSPRGVSQRSLF